MKASHFPRIYRAYDLERKIMLSPERLASEGFTIAPDGMPSNSMKAMFDIVVLWYSGQLDKDRKPIFEGDICKCHIANEFGSMTVDYGVMRWNNDVHQFLLMIPSAFGGQLLKVQTVELLGNEFENPELVPLVKTEDKTS